MRKYVLVIIALTGFAAALLFLSKAGNKPVGYVAANAATPAFAPGVPHALAPDAFWGRQIDLALSRLHSDAYPDTNQDGAYRGWALQALSQYYPYASSDLKKDLRRIAAELVSNESDEPFTNPDNFTDAAAWTFRTGLMGLLHYYRTTGRRIALQSCEDRLAAFYPQLLSENASIKTSSQLPMALLEPMALLYSFTGKEPYRGACNAFLRAIEKNPKPATDPQGHSRRMELAYLKGLLEVYRFEGARDLFQKCVHAWEILKETDVAAAHTVDWFLLCARLFELSGDVRYAEEMETTLYNALLSDWRQWQNGRPSESEAIIAAGLAHIPHYISSVFQDRLVINLYEKGIFEATLSLKDHEQTVRYLIDTEYPRNGTVEVTVFPGRKTKFSLLLRTPAWCTDFDVRIGEDAFRGAPGQYLELSREWKDGDIVRICMNLQIRQERTADSLVLARGPQILAAPVHLNQPLLNTADGRREQLYTATFFQNDANKTVALTPAADVFPPENVISVLEEDWRPVGELPSSALAKLRKQLNGFRHEFGGANDMPDVKFFLFGMGNRPKFIYRDGILMNAMNSDTIRAWSFSHQAIVPNEYRVEILSLEGDTISIFENENGVYIREKGQLPVMLEGTNAFIKLPEFAGRPYDQILRVLHHEILINILDHNPLPNFLAYPKPWRRDAAMMAMCLEKTGNLDLIREWVLNLDRPYDYNNQMNGIPEEEADNLGQTLYLLSLFADRDHPLAQQILTEIPKFEKIRFGKKYIEGRSDFNEHAAYQTKWLKFGLKRMGISDPYVVPGINEGYNTLFWWDYQDPEREAETVEVWRYYPYISWAKDHYFGTKNSPISNRDYPLTWEIQASQADYEKLKIIDPSYWLEQNASPHTWHAAEVFLYLYEMN